MIKLLLLAGLAVVSAPAAIAVALVSAIGFVLLLPLRLVATVVRGLLRAVWAVVSLPLRPFLGRT